MSSPYGRFVDVNVLTRVCVNFFLPCVSPFALSALVIFMVLVLLLCFDKVLLVGCPWVCFSADFSLLLLRSTDVAASGRLLLAFCALLMVVVLMLRFP